HVLHHDLRTARVRLRECREDLDRCRLAGAVWTEEPEHFALSDLERHSVQRLDVAVALAQVLDDDRVHAIESSDAALQPDSGRAPGGRLENRDLPGQLPGAPEARADTRSRCDKAGGGVVEALAAVDDLADEPAVRAPNANLRAPPAVLERVRSHLGGGEKHV